MEAAEFGGRAGDHPGEPRRRAPMRGDIMFAKMMEALELMYPEIPLCIHQDHGERVSTCLSAIQNGLHLGDDGRLAQGRRQDPVDL